MGFSTSDLAAVSVMTVRIFTVVSARQHPTTKHTRRNWMWIWAFTLDRISDATSSIQITDVLQAAWFVPPVAADYRLDPAKKPYLFTFRTRRDRCAESQSAHDASLV